MVDGLRERFDLRSLRIDMFICGGFAVIYITYVTGIISCNGDFGGAVETSVVMVFYISTSFEWLDKSSVACASGHNLDGVVFRHGG
jgi:hypothetical protein